MSDEHKSFTESLLALQAEMPVMPKNKGGQIGNQKYKYTPLDVIVEQVQPLLTKHGFAGTACPTLMDGDFGLYYRLHHKSGESLDGLYPLPADVSVRDIGSAITYARRYALCAVLNIVAD